MNTKKKEEHLCMARGCEFTASDGIKRSVSLARGPGSRVRLAYETWWDGAGKEPFRTEVILTLPALNATMALLAELQAHPELFQVIEPG